MLNCLLSLAERCRCDTLTRMTTVARYTANEPLQVQDKSNLKSECTEEVAETRGFILLI